MSLMSSISPIASIFRMLFKGRDSWGIFSKNVKSFSRLFKLIVAGHAIFAFILLRSSYSKVFGFLNEHYGALNIVITSINVAMYVLGVYWIAPNIIKVISSSFGKDISIDEIRAVACIPGTVHLAVLFIYAALAIVMVSIKGAGSSHLFDLFSYALSLLLIPLTIYVYGIILYIISKIMNIGAVVSAYSAFLALMVFVISVLVLMLFPIIAIYLYI